jgi:hypothetical protein
MRLQITDFIHKNTDWEAAITDAPYHLKIKREGCFILLKYDHLRSDMNIELVRECRGIILDESNRYLPVCVPFFKFGNIGESYVPAIDWKSSHVQEKLDGSLIKLWHYKGQWHVSSNGEIDARNAHLNSALLKNAYRIDLHTLFIEAWNKTGVQMDSLDENYTYMFELTSPHNRIVVRYDDTTIRHIGTRDIHTLRECEIDIGIPKPYKYAFSSIEDCIESAKKLGYDNEGYVIVDGNYNRVKVKSPLYVALNHISQGVTTHGNIVDIIKKNEQDEFLIYFPEFQEVFEDILARIQLFSKMQTDKFNEIYSMEFDSRKALAEVVTKTECPACIFALFDGKVTSATEWLLSRPTIKVLGYIDG